VYPSEGTGLRYDASGIIKGGPNLANAKLWMDFLTTKEAIGLISQAPHFRRMVRPDVAPPPGPAPERRDQVHPVRRRGRHREAGRVPQEVRRDLRVPVSAGDP